MIIIIMVVINGRASSKKNGRKVIIMLTYTAQNKGEAESSSVSFHFNCVPRGQENIFSIRRRSSYDSLSGNQQKWYTNAASRTSLP